MATKKKAAAKAPVKKALKGTKKVADSKLMAAFIKF